MTVSRNTTLSHRSIRVPHFQPLFHPKIPYQASIDSSMLPKLRGAALPRASTLNQPPRKSGSPPATFFLSRDLPRLPDLRSEYDKECEGASRPTQTSSYLSHSALWKQMMAHCLPGDESYDFEAEHVIIVEEPGSKAKAKEERRNAYNCRRKRNPKTSFGRKRSAPRNRRNSIKRPRSF